MFGGLNECEGISRCLWYTHLIPYTNVRIFASSCFGKSNKRHLQTDSKGGVKWSSGTVGNVRWQYVSYEFWSDGMPDLILAICDVEGNFLVVKVGS